MIAQLPLPPHCSAILSPELPLRLQDFRIDFRTISLSFVKTVYSCALEKQFPKLYGLFAELKGEPELDFFERGDCSFCFEGLGSH